MDYKKEYKEALERAKAGKPMDEVFPELKESDDEKMRKFLLKYFVFYRNHPDLYITPNKWQGINTSDIIDWLEKQKEKTNLAWSEDDENKSETIKRILKKGDLSPNGIEITPTRTAWKGIANALINIQQYMSTKKQDFEKGITEADVKELVDYIDLTINNVLSASLLNIRDKRTWSEDDKDKVEAMCEEGNLKPSEREWLRNLKYRVQKPAWSDDEKKMLYGLIEFCKAAARGSTVVTNSGTFGKWADLIEERIYTKNSL